MRSSAAPTNNNPIRAAMAAPPARMRKGWQVARHRRRLAGLAANLCLVALGRRAYANFTWLTFKNWLKKAAPSWESIRGSSQEFSKLWYEVNDVWRREWDSNPRYS